MGLHVRADTPVPEQVDLRAQHGLYELIGGEGLPIDGQQFLCRLGQHNVFGRAGPDTATIRNEVRVVVGPAAARLRVQSPAFGVTGGRIGIRVDENVPVVEGGHQPQIGRVQHAVAEYIPRAVPDAGHRNGFSVDIDPDLGEMIAYRYPCAPCGDAHLFVVVASGATGGERIAQPEAALCGNMVSDVREGCGALVGGYHQVIAVRTVGHRMGGVHGFAVGNVVGHVEQSVNEYAVCLSDSDFRVLADEYALGSRRHDREFLTVWVFIRPSTSVR